MPPLGNKSKTKVKEHRRSRSRNTTPSSVLSANESSSASGVTLYLGTSIPPLKVPSNLQYEDLLAHHGGPTGGVPDVDDLRTLLDSIRMLGELAGRRDEVSNEAVRALKDKRKTEVEEEADMMDLDLDDRSNLKRAAEEDGSGKQKKRKDQGKPREERPLAHGAHGVARQDGREATPKGWSSRFPFSQHWSNNECAHDPRFFPISPIFYIPHHDDQPAHFLLPAHAPKASASPSKARSSAASGSSSSLSPPSQVQSPTTTAAEPKAIAVTKASPASSSSSDDSHQPPPAASVPQYQTFGSNPLTFNDPTTYHIRKVTNDMTDEEKKEIYCVAGFPHDDLKTLIAGEPPDRDFSNAKPTNQVNANTFASFLEPYFRPFTEEDLTFLRERGDRATPFIIARRGAKHYKQVWAEEDANYNFTEPPPPPNKLSGNQPRGSADQIDDDNAHTDHVSGGPMLNRLLATMRFEHRPEEKERVHGVTNGDGSTNGFMNGDHGDLPDAPPPNGEEETSRPPATAFAESSQPQWKVPTAKQDFGAVDERLKAELRYIGFLGAEAEPDYDAHYDDEIAQRLRVLQAELKQVMILNGARKARLYDLAKEQMGFQEFSAIRDDLDNQVVQAFLKRNRTLGKGKKHVKRPAAGAAGGAHAGAGVVGGAGVSKPGIGDVARTLLDRRRRWRETLEPVFSEDVITVRGAGDLVFTPEVMEPLMQAERERLEEELAE